MSLSNCFWHLTSHLNDGGLDFLVAESQYKAFIYDSVPPQEK